MDSLRVGGWTYDNVEITVPADVAGQLRTLLLQLKRFDGLPFDHVATRLRNRMRDVGEELQTGLNILVRRSLENAAALIAEISLQVVFIAASRTTGRDLATRHRDERTVPSGNDF